MRPLVPLNPQGHKVWRHAGTECQEIPGQKPAHETEYQQAAPQAHDGLTTAVRHTCSGRQRTLLSCFDPSGCAAFRQPCQQAPAPPAEGPLTPWSVCPTPPPPRSPAPRPVSSALQCSAARHHSVRLRPLHGWHACVSCQPPNITRARSLQYPLRAMSYPATPASIHKQRMP